ncbi:phosphonate ABC transporter, permease protein PhnE [Pseudolactococcus reticulitermitis]|uniref:ABC transmembrane type-1 domain-containing protein n=1 Tax=Pseudolactococcus reticulitermitis TaxID=2025039 RepID=A0A224X0T4_9LACT|nr:phosphonate ABC transporter, permease protein PhnE [Lactococcus reticulitermitis]GAX47827.1 hypothetical protein RsY01_1431 [Lactococcus reticulitermitis]
MYDKIFKPKKLVLESGEVVYEKATRTPIIWLIVIGLLIFSLKFTSFQFSALIERGSNFFDMLKRMMPPDTGYLPKVIKPLLDTIKMSFIGSIIGSVLAIPFAILASSNIVHNVWLNKIVRVIFTFLRTLPTLVTALIATYIFGLGTFAGTLAIFIFSFSYMGKQMFEVIETVDMGAFEAMESMGATKIKAFTFAIVPQIMPIYLSTTLFNFEGNVRYAAILGYVGAGGIGMILNDRVNNRDYTSVGMILLALLVTVMTIELVSQVIRRKLT